MKKAFDQTVRDLKRGVNKKVLKVPSIEQKVLDATSNEAWGPHGSVLADIAQATKNYHEYQMIMAVIWKRINDTGKNWRHVYKALTVLEYLVAHGSERVIDDIREHGYQISTLSDFQYIDSSGRDQGNNIRKKSQSLVVLVNDKERLQEVRQKAAVNRDKYRNTTVGGMYRPGSGSYGDKYDDDGRYGNRDDDCNGYGRERDWASRDDDKGRYGDAYGRDGDRYGRYGEDRSSRDGYKDDDYRGRSQSVGDYSYGSRSRSADGERYRPNEDDEQHSSRGSGARADEHSQDGRLDHKYSEQRLGAPPSYEEAVSAGHSPTYSERDRESSVSNAPKASSPTAASPSYTATAAPAPVGPASPSAAPVAPSPSLAQPTGQDSNNMEEFGFDEFDPRGASLAAPTTSLAPAASAVEVDLLGSLSESFSSNALALVTTGTEDESSVVFNSGSPNVAAPSPSTVNNQYFDDPFGDGPFKAISSADTIPVQQHITASTDSTSSFEAAPQNAFGVEPTNTQSLQSAGIEDIDILADILPPSAPSSSSINPQNGYNVPQQPMSHGGFALQTNQPPPPQFGLPFQGNSFQPQPNLPGSGFPGQPDQHLLQSNPLRLAESVPQTGYTNQTMALTYPVQTVQESQPVLSTQGGLAHPNHQANLNFYGNYNAQPVSVSGPPLSGFSAVPPMSGGPFFQQNSLSQPGSANYMPLHMGSQVPQVRPISNVTSTISTTPASTGPVSQPSKEKFEMKSSVWADTLSRGLVDLNISGQKTNPLADIGVDFDAINRKEKRMEKPSTASTTTPTSTVTMGKAMGSGSGLGRAGASALTAPPNAMMGSGNMGMGMGMGGYGFGQPMGRGMGPGMDLNMGTGQGFNMQQQPGFRPGSAMPGNPYYSQQPYGGGYR